MRERLIALFGGAVTALIGARRRSALALARARRPRELDRRSPHVDGVEQRRTVLIQLPRAELYRALHDLEQLPRYLDHLTRVTVGTDGLSHFQIVQGDDMIEWIAHLTEDVPGEKIVWESLPGGDLIAGGAITLRDGSRTGTVVDVEVWYRPPMGSRIKDAVRAFFSKVSGRKMAANLLVLRQLAERGDLRPRLAPANENAPGPAKTIRGPWPLATEPAQSSNH